MSTATDLVPKAPLPAGLDPPFEMGAAAREIYAQIAPLLFAERDTDYAWARLLTAAMDPVETVIQMVRDDRDGNPGWTALASPQRCPPVWLPVLAQWAGVKRWDAMSDDDLRLLIGPRAPGMWAGTRDAMIAAARRFLPPGMADSLLFFQARADETALGHPFLIRVFTYEFVDHDPALVRRALWTAKPWGFLLDYEVQQGQAWFMLNERMGSWADVQDSYGTWGDVHRDNPL